MAMSKDKVEFFLGHRYFDGSCNGMREQMCNKILQESFGMLYNEIRGIMKEEPKGFHITCRPSQFARFIVLRHEAGECINGIRDLNPKIVDQPTDLYDEAATITGISRADVKRVAYALGFSGLPAKKVTLDVSCRHYCK